jgi:hypothetical protein
VTEQEWDGCDDPEMMLEFLEWKARDRKLRLLACAWCRHLLGQVSVNSWGWKAVDVAELFAAGKASPRDLQDAAAAATTGATAGLAGASRSASLACGSAASPKGGSDAAYYAVALTGSAVREHAAVIVAAGDDHPAFAAGGEEALTKERCPQAALVRDLLGNPFRPVAVDPAWLAWRGGAVVKLAQAVYEERELPSGHLDAARLAILADMLEESGCTDAEILGHLRGPGPHVRGCWALDALLGKV